MKMSDPLGCVILECALSDARNNPAQDVEMPRIRTAPSKRSSVTGRISELVRPDAFLREIDAYERKLRSFQGDSIPRCYGLYQFRYDDETISFLVLKFSGFPIDFYVDYPMELKTDILDKLTTLHYAGFCHGDLEDYNIVVKDGKAVFIDLEDVEPHDCQLKHAIIPKDLQPSVTDFGCREIYHIVCMLNVWQKPFVNFYGIDIYLDHIKPGRAKDMLWRIRLRLQTESEFEQAYADAQKLIEDVEEWRQFYATITDEERKFTFTMPST